MSEAVIGTINAIKPQGLKGDLHLTLIFTSQRLIAAFKGMLAQLASGGAFGVAGAALASRQDSKNRSQMQEVSPDQLLQANKKNFEVPYSRITRLELGKKHGQTRLHVIAQDQIYQFKFQGSKIEQIESWIRNAIPPTVPLQVVETLSD